MAKLILMDGNSIAFRAFYGLPLLTNKSGLHTNAVFGYARLLEKVIKEEDPDYFLVAFDAGKSTFRHKQYKEYKGGRQKTPPELGEQFAPIRQLIDAYGIKRFEHEDYEADDIIGTWTKLADEEGLETIVITGDKDLTQLASEKTKVYITKKGVTDIEVFTPEHLAEVYDGLQPLQIIDLKGLMGDKSDNIPGVPGVGEKTAVKLLKEYGSVENVLDNLDKVTAKKLNENLTNNRDIALMSKDLATIYRDMDFDFKIDDLKFKDEDRPEKYELFKDMEFNSLLDKMDEQEVEEVAEFTAKPTTSFKDFSDAVSVFLEVHGENYLKLQPEFIGISDEQFVMTKKVEDIDLEDFKEFLESRKTVKTYDLKRQVALLDHLDIKFDHFTDDIMLASFLINPSKKIIDVAETVADFNISINSDDFHYGKGRNKKDPSTEETIDFLSDKVQAIHQVADLMTEKLKKDEMYSLWHDLEIPLAKVLVQMVLKGIKVQRERLEKMEVELQGQLDDIEEKIYELAGEKFNINSPKQLGVILFEKLELPVIKKTKTGYSTAVDVLEKLQDKHEIIDYILHYRTVSKLQSTYVIGLQDEVSEDGRIHTRFNQTLAQTGRLSSVEPNLQNIPIRLEEGRKIRQAFVPSKEENVLLGLDYSQIELRVLAAITKDESMMEAFNNDIDIHTKTAMEVYGVELDGVTPIMRRNAKAVNFGIVYGISDYGLSQNLGITRKEAAQFIDTYLSSFKDVKQFMHDVVQDAKRDGYVTTLLHRRRYLPDINSRNFNARSFAERTAMNSPIQGSAADIIKLAMVKYAESEKVKDFDVELLLQIHDELIFDIPKSQVEDFIPVITEIMEDALEIGVPLKVEAGYGKDWYEVK